MIWPWLVALLLVWSTIGAVTAHAASRLLSRSLHRRAGWLGAAVAWAEYLAGVIVAGALWPVAMAIWARGGRFEIEWTR
ncbi:hypothetical protein [Sphaerisporangium sp. TRM90804]|uniref:hypothetical protein n=1 Tax=Sphaerisporangium sp. TRM90804 TaxID=3031113 RepID=UPI00244B57D6|nr:hypothetical protein [Sphaerisporangium sp. TRM90804]MDH2425745.1 hypothetical protein [Sphaerisporangium sp. TRM90804]